MWYYNDYRRIFMDMHINDSNPEYLSKFDVKYFVKTMKEAEITALWLRRNLKWDCIYAGADRGTRLQTMFGRHNQIFDG